MHFGQTIVISRLSAVPGAPTSEKLPWIALKDNAGIGVLRVGAPLQKRVGSSADPAESLVTASISSGPSLSTLFTSVETSSVDEGAGGRGPQDGSEGRGVQRDWGRSTPPGPWAPPPPASGRARKSTSGPLSVVTIVQLWIHGAWSFGSYGSRQEAQSPANASGSPSERVK